jgi:O-antigen/teichoic acid export membrane protein
MSSIADPNRYTRNDTSRMNLRERAVRSGFIQIGAQALQLALIIGSGMALARLLTPEDFGLLAMASSLTAFVGNLRDFGLPLATVHRETVDHQQVSALFWVNLKLNLLTTLFMALTAPALAWFYKEGRLTAMTLVMAVGFFCLGLTDQHKSLLMRQMRFGSLTFIDVGSVLTGIIVGIGAALLGARYWALVLQFLADALTRSITTWLVCGWRPAWSARRFEMLNPDLRSLLSYGAHLTGFRILSHIGRHLDRVLVGYFGGVTAVGLYDNAYRWALYPVQRVYVPLLGVAVASLSRVQHDPKAYCASLKEGLLPVLSVVMPTLAFMIIEARGVILVLLGSQWLEAVPLFRLLCIAAFATSMSRVTKWLYLSQGETKRQLRWGLIDTPVMVLAVAVGIQWGALGVAVSYTVTTCLLTYPSIAFCLKTSHLSLRDFLGIVWRPALASVMAAILLLAAGTAIPKWNSMAIELLMKLIAFGLAYLLLWVALPGGRQAIADARRLVAELWPHGVDTATAPEITR